MKRYIIIFILLFTSTVLMAFELSGVWSDVGDIAPSDYKEMTFSWGTSVMAGNGRSIAIDDKAQEPRFYISGFGSYPIKQVINIDDVTTELIYFFILEDRDISCIFHWFNENQFWIEPIDGISMFPTGESYVYDKIEMVVE